MECFHLGTVQLYVVCLCVCLSASMPVWLPACLSVCLFVCLSACLSVSLWLQVSKQIPYLMIVFIVYKHSWHFLYYCRFNRRMCFELCSADEIQTQIPGGCVGVVWLDRGGGGSVVGGPTCCLEWRGSLSGRTIDIGTLFHTFI